MSLLTQFYPGPGGGGGIQPWDNEVTAGMTSFWYVLDSGEVVAAPGTTGFNFSSNPGDAAPTLQPAQNTVTNLKVVEAYIRGGGWQGGAQIAASLRVLKTSILTWQINNPQTTSFSVGSQLEELYVGVSFCFTGGAQNTPVLDLRNCSNLRSVTIKGFQASISAVMTLNCQGCALDQASVDGLLSSYAKALQRFTTVPAFTLDLSLGTNATPSAWASALIPVITAAGGTVNTN